ncbi:MAG: hypothetical protein ABIE14_04915 [Patescibacteria group bacterium]
MDVGKWSVSWLATSASNRLDGRKWKVEDGGLLTTRLLKFKSQISPNPSFPSLRSLRRTTAGCRRKRGFLFGSPAAAGSLEKDDMFLSLFRKRGMAKQEFLNCRKKVEPEIWCGMAKHLCEKRNEVSETEI